MTVWYSLCYVSRFKLGFEELVFRFTVVVAVATTSSAALLSIVAAISSASSLIFDLLLILLSPSFWSSLDDPAGSFFVVNLVSRLLLLLRGFFKVDCVLDIEATVFDVDYLKLEDEKWDTEVVVIFF